MKIKPVNKLQAAAQRSKFAVMVIAAVLFIGLATVHLSARRRMATSIPWLKSLLSRAGISRGCCFAAALRRWATGAGDRSQQRDAGACHDSTEKHGCPDDVGRSRRITYSPVVCRGWFRGNHAYADNLWT